MIDKRDLPLLHVYVFHIHFEDLYPKASWKCGGPEAIYGGTDASTCLYRECKQPLDVKSRRASVGPR